MSYEENKDRADQDRRYRESQSDIKQMRGQMDKLVGAVGEITVAIVGNEMGSEGIISRQKTMNERLDTFELRLDAMEEVAREAKLAADKRQFYLITIFTLVGVILGSAMNAIFNHFSKK